MPFGSVPSTVITGTSPASAPVTPPLIVVQRPLAIALTSIEPLRSAPSMSSMLTVRLAMSEVVTAEGAMRLPVIDEMARSEVLSPPSAILVVPSVSSRMSLLVSVPFETSMPVSDELATSSPVSELLAMSTPPTDPSITLLESTASAAMSVSCDGARVDPVRGDRLTPMSSFLTSPFLMSTDWIDSSTMSSLPIVSAAYAVPPPIAAAHPIRANTS